jgi:hypothetical protein
MSVNIRNCVFGFKCTNKWESLNATAVDNIKFCDDCQKEVYFIEDLVSLDEAIALNRCIAINTTSKSEKIVNKITVGMLSSVNYDEAAFKRNKESK